MLGKELRDKTELRREVIQDNELKPGPRMTREQLKELKHLITDLRKEKRVLLKLHPYRRDQFSEANAARCYQSYYCLPLRKQRDLYTMSTAS